MKVINSNDNEVMGELSVAEDVIYFNPTTAYQNSTLFREKGPLEFKVVEGVEQDMEALSDCLPTLYSTMKKNEVYLSFNRYDGENFFVMERRGKATAVSLYSLDSVEVLRKVISRFSSV